MSRELRATLALMIVVLIAGAPLIFADAPQQPTSSYLALVFHQVPPTNTLVPTETPPPPTATRTPTNTPLPTSIPLPTLTPTDIVFDIPPVQPPCDQNIPPQINPGANAWMTIPNPSRFSFTTVCARYIIDTVVDRGAILEATAHYKTTDTYLGMVAVGSDGVAHLSFNIGGATLGYPVTVDGTIGGRAFSTTFTPQ